MMIEMGMAMMTVVLVNAAVIIATMASEKGAGLGNRSRCNRKSETNVALDVKKESAPYNYQF